jgi:hypothetical protein
MFPLCSGLSGAAMIFIWTGRGFWTALFPILFLGVVGMGVSFALGERTLDANPWIFGVALLGAAVANWAYGRRWNGTEGLKPWDVKAALRYRRLHRVFGLPMELWSAPLAAFGVWIIVASLVDPSR